jgi:peptidoglycan/xylan/chitin deacetylase (PgdA/CDA1 family)
MFPPKPSIAANGAPTAQVLVASPQAEVSLNGNLAVRLAATPVSDVAAPTSADLPTAIPAATAAVPTIPARPEPTLTITPVPLGDIGAAPIPTLFPTQPGAAPAAPPPQTGPAAPVDVPILMYHYIRTVDSSLDPMGYNLSIAPDDFAQEMNWLHEQGYTTVAMATVQQCLRGEIVCPPKPIALTFDDGYEDAFSTALPILQRFGMRGTFYIVNTFVGQPGYMTWEQLAAMRDAGMEIGAHTVSHLNLTTLDQATIAAEVGNSKAELDRQLGIKVTSLCYPAGFYDATVEALTQAAGYTNATTTRWDNDYSDILALPRRRVAGGTALDAFVGLVTGG